MNTSPLTHLSTQRETERLSIATLSTENRLGRTPLIFLLALLLLLAWAGVTSANGIPVQIFLDHVPVKTTWTPADGGRGVAVVSANDEQVRVMAQNLPAPPNGTSYYTWLEKVGGGFLPVGALLYQSDGTASLDQPMPGLPYSENFSWVIVSLENPQVVGSRPGVDIALAGRLPNAEALPLSGNDAPQLLPVTGTQSSGPSPTALLLIALLSVAGLIGTLRLYGQRKSPNPSRIRSDDSTAGQKPEKRQ